MICTFKSQMTFEGVYFLWQKRDKKSMYSPELKIPQK